MFGEYQEAALALSLATAVAAGTNVAINPGDTARRNRVARDAYARARRKWEDFAYFESEESDHLVPKSRRKELRDEINALEKELKDIEDSV